MFSDLPNKQADEPEEVASSEAQPISLLPFAVQLQNIFPVEIRVKRFPMDQAIDLASVVSTAHTRLNLSDLGIQQETLRAQIHLEIHVSFPLEPPPFEIFFKLVGIFSYTQEYPPEMVQYFLQQGSLSVMLPYARELLLNLCTRLQIPMIVLPLVQLTPPSSSSETE